jgi:hypothetical protein
MPYVQHHEQRPDRWHCLHDIVEIAEGSKNDSVPEDPPHHLPPGPFEDHTSVRGTSHARAHEAGCQSTAIGKQILHLPIEESALCTSPTAQTVQGIEKTESSTWTKKRKGCRTGGEVESNTWGRSLANSARSRGHSFKASESSKETRSQRPSNTFKALLEHLLNRWLSIGACWSSRDVSDSGVNIDAQVTRPFLLAGRMTLW